MPGFIAAFMLHYDEHIDHEWTHSASLIAWLASASVGSVLSLRDAGSDLVQDVHFPFPPPPTACDFPETKLWVIATHPRTFVSA